MDLLYKNIFSPFFGLNPRVSSSMTTISSVFSDCSGNRYSLLGSAPTDMTMPSRLADVVPPFISSIQNFSSLADGSSFINIFSDVEFMDSMISASSSIPNTMSLLPILL